MPTTAQQIDTWRAAKSETDTLEFKEAKNSFDFGDLLAYCVAIANERGGKLLLGITDKPPRRVVATRAYLNTVKTAEDVFGTLRFRVDVEEVEHPDGRVLIFHIPSRPIGEARHLNGRYLMRLGSSTVPMTPEQLKKINAEGSNTKRHIAVAALIVITIIFSTIVGVGWTRPRVATRTPRNVEVKSPEPKTPPEKQPARALNSPKKVSKPHLSVQVPGTGPDANGNWTATTEEFPSEGNSGTVFVYLLNNSDAPFDGGYLNVDYEKGFEVTSDHPTTVHSFRLRSDVWGITIEVKSIPPHGRFQFNLTVSASQRFTVTDLHFQIEGEPKYLSTVTVRNGKDL